MKTLLSNLSIYWKERPLTSIIVIALVIRVVAAVFSQGYGMHDDHFIVIEEPWSWTQGEDYDGWLPGTKGPDAKPSIFSFFYPGINYLTFSALQSISIDNPKVQMVFVRLLLALLSLLTVLYGYKIAKLYASNEVAKKVGLLLAILWFMPFFGVRNLVEIVATPPLLIGTWLLLKNMQSAYNKNTIWAFVIAGLITGIAFTIRFQSIIYIGGLGLVLLYFRKWKEAIVYGLGNLLVIGIIMGGIDFAIWGEPFATLKGYIEYNFTHKNAYGNQTNVLMYVELIPGLLIPPIGALLFFGFFLKIKKHLLLFLPTFLFIAFHTYFPNRQERFILTIMPMVVILGYIGWDAFYQKSKWWAKHKKLYKGFWNFFWVINSILLLVVTLTYSKRSRVEAMHFFYKNNQAVNTIIVDDTGRKSTMMMPVFYSGKAIKTITISNLHPEDTLITPEHSYIQVCHSINVLEDKSLRPEYIVFVENKALDERIEKMKTYYPKLSFEAYIEPSLTDKIMKKMNPNNKNEDFYIYKTNIQ